MNLKNFLILFTHRLYFGRPNCDVLKIGILLSKSTWSTIEPSPPSTPVKLGEGFLFFKIWTRRGVIKKLLRNRVLVKRGGCLRKRDFPNCFVSFPQKSGKIVSSKNYFRKACFHYCCNTIFFCLANIHTCCNQ